MSMLDVHAAALETVSEAYHDFLLRFDRTKKVVYGFVEGKDDPSFYRSVIERFIPEDWTVDLIRAGNRSKVLQAEEEFDWSRYSRKQISFFVDRDLTGFKAVPPVYSENTYVTDAYSIENAIVTAEVMLRLLAEVHNVVDWTPEEQQALMEHFNTQLDRFTEAMNPIMAQILYWRMQDIPANLNNLDLPSIFHFNAGEVCTAAEFDHEDARVDRLCECVGAPKADALERKEMSDALCSSGEPKKWVRGKYLVWFLSGVINDVHKDISKFLHAYNHPPKSKLSIGPKNVMVVAAPRARIPTSLRAFVENGFNQFIRDKQAV